MNFRGGLLTGIGSTLLVVAALLATWWVATTKHAPAKAALEPPAKIDKVLKEDQINNLTLTADALRRLALASAPITVESVARSRTYGGEVVLPPGQAMIVSAPVSGFLKAASGGKLKPGQLVEAGETLFELLPILTPEGRANLASTLVQTEGDVNAATAQRDAQEIVLNRAKRVFENEAGSRRALDDAQAQFNLAEQTLAAAGKRHDTLRQLVGETSSGTGTAGPILIECPLSGLVRSVSSAPDQIVPAGAALFEVIDVHRMWVKVSLHSVEAAAVDFKAEAKLGPLSTRPGEYTSTALPVAAPPTANPLSGTVDLYYEIDQEDSVFRPGERVGAQLPLVGRKEAPTIAWDSVVHDIYGGTWVYEQTEKHTFVRRRVVVEHVSNGKAVLVGGPPPGAMIVVAGAAELFGTETGFTK